MGGDGCGETICATERMRRGGRMMAKVIHRALHVNYHPAKKPHHGDFRIVTLDSQSAHQFPFTSPTHCFTTNDPSASDLPFSSDAQTAEVAAPAFLSL